MQQDRRAAPTFARLLAVAALVAAVAAVVAGCGTSSALPTIPPITPGPTLPADATAVTLRDFAFGPAAPSVPSGGTLAIRNEGKVIHNITVQDAATREVLLASKDLPSGGTQSISVRLPAGSYRLVCTVTEHERLGMTGALTVTR